VHPGRSYSRVDFSLFSSAKQTPEEMLSAILFGTPQELVIDLDLIHPEAEESRNEEKLYAIVKKIEKDARFVLRETGLHPVWMAYPVVYLRHVQPGTNRIDDILAPIFLCKRSPRSLN